MFKDRYILAAITIAIVALQVAIWPIILKINDLPDVVTFWHTLPPAGRLAPANQLWYIPGVAVAIVAINTTTAYFMHRRYPTISQLLVSVAAVVCLLAAITIIKTILIYTTLL